jgi:threonine dehydrogenase-like Zn-dependent dehydrogenase
MRALCWHGKGDVRVDTVPDPKIQHPRDAVIKITACAICGSDLHLLDGYQPTMESGDILGHENMGRGDRTGIRGDELESRGPGRRALHH